MVVRCATAFRRGLPACVVLALATCAAGCGEPLLSFAPLESQVTYVGESLKLPLVVEYAKGEEVTLWYTGPSLPNLDRWARIVERSDGIEFQWTPTAAHVGRHRFVFVAVTASEHATQEVWIEVRAAREAVPVFERPPPGAALDLARDPCLVVPIEVRDGDSPEVDLGVVAGLPRGAELATTGPLSAELRWCPAPDQVAAAEQWLITLRADDGEHEPVFRDFRALLVAPHKPGCPGAPPRLEWVYPNEGEQVISFVGYDVAIRVDDEGPLRDPPLLLWTIGRLEQRDQIDLAQLEVNPFRWTDDRWVAHIPSFVLATDEFRTVTLVPWVSDNDDPTGTRCDHRAELRSRRFVAIGAIEAGVLPDCAPCVQSGDCISGVCLADPDGGRCVPACEVDPGCTLGECGPRSAAEGLIRFACGDVDAVCRGLSACLDDDFEDNDRAGMAVAVPEGEVTGIVCDRDADFYEFDPPAEGRVSVSLTPQPIPVGDLELRLRDASGTIVGVSAGPGDQQVDHCVPGGAQLEVEVHAPQAQRGGYVLNVDHAAEACACLDDSFEPDGTDAPIALDANVEHQGTICPGDTDAFAVTGDPESRTRIELSFDRADADLDLELTGPTGRLVARAQGAGDRETLEVDLPDEATYQLRVYAFDGGRADYRLSLGRDDLAACAESRECEPGEICTTGRCRRVLCARNLDCPGGHVCPLVDTGSDVRTCLHACRSDADCGVNDACKAFFEGRACAPAGLGRTGTSCETAADCAGDRACIDWPGGYCAAAGCGDDFSCGPDSTCGVVDGRALCVLDCWVDDAVCQRPDAYQCGELFAPDAELVYGCFPQER